MKSRKSKALVALALVVMMLVSACSGSQKSAPSTTAAGGIAAPTTADSIATPANFKSDSNLNAPGELPIVKKPVSIKIIYSATTALADNYATKYIQDKTGITIDWILFPVDQYKEKLNLSLASSDKADLIIPPNAAAARLTKIEEFKYASQGLLTPLNDYIKYSSKNVKALYDEFPEYYQAVTAPDGNIYSFQDIKRPGRGAYHGTASYKLWINKSWIDRLGLQMPTTTDELYNVLKAFKEKDANGNGDPNDEIPLSTCTKGSNVQIDGYLMNAFTYNDPNPNNTTPYLRVSDDGKIEASVTDPNYREGLLYLNKLYSEGLLYPDSFTQDRATQAALNESGNASRIGALPAQHCGYLVASMTESDRWMEYESLDPIKGPSGLQQTPTPHITADVFPSGLIPKTSENPEVAFRLIDTFYTDEFSLVINNGEEGKSWKLAGPNALDSSGKPAVIETMPLPETDPYFNNYRLPGFPAISPTAITSSVDQDPKAPKGAGHEVVLYRATARMEPYKVPMKNVIPNFYYLSEENEKISSYKATINPYIEESIARFVTGDLNLKKDWDNYLKELDSLGLKDYLAIVQDGYDRWKATSKQ